CPPSSLVPLARHRHACVWLPLPHGLFQLLPFHRPRLFRPRPHLAPRSREPALRFAHRSVRASRSSHWLPLASQRLRLPPSLRTPSRLVQTRLARRCFRRILRPALVFRSPRHVSRRLATPPALSPSRRRPAHPLRRSLRNP